MRGPFLERLLPKIPQYCLNIPMLKQRASQLLIKSCFPGCFCHLSNWINSTTVETKPGTPKDPDFTQHQESLKLKEKNNDCSIDQFHQGKLKPELAAITEELQEEISNQLSRFTAVMRHNYHHHQDQENIAGLIGCSYASSLSQSPT